MLLLPDSTFFFFFFEGLPDNTWFNNTTSARVIHMGKLFYEVHLCVFYADKYHLYVFFHAGKRTVFTLYSIYVNSTHFLHSSVIFIFYFSSH